MLITRAVPSWNFVAGLGPRNFQSSLWSAVRARVALPSSAEPMLVLGGAAVGLIAHAVQ